MKNKHVGLLVLGITTIFLLLVISFNFALETIVTQTCTHGVTCPMHTTVKTQKIISYSLVGLLYLIGFTMVFFIPPEKILINAIPLNKEDDEEKKPLLNLNEKEEEIMSLIKREEGSIYQSDLVKETGLSKVKITRILDKLEGKGIIERKRRGMTNVVVHK